MVMLCLPIMTLAEENTKTIGYLGVSTEELSDAMKTALNVESGILVSGVQQDSPADVAGIKQGDIIVKIDGTVISDYKTLKTTVADRPMQKVKVDFIRSDKKMSKTVELGEKEKKSITITMDLPELPEIKEMCKHGMKEIEVHMDYALDEIKEEIEKLKEDIEELKKKVE
jgi:predicted metalloprotease with PDZ domain